MNSDRFATLTKRLSWPGLTFDADQHRYFLNDAELVSVGSVLKGVGLVDTFWMDKYPEAKQRGQYVHQACDLIDQDALDDASLDPALANYVKGYRKFITAHRPTWIASELLVCCVDESIPPEKNGWRRGWAGTPDRIEAVVTESPRSYGDEKDIRLRVWDIKSGTKQPSHRWQTAGYAVAVAKRLGIDPHLIERRVVRLTKAGGFVVDGADWNPTDDLKVWMSAARVVDARIGNRLWNPELSN
jgi:hypothetical protein